MASEMVKAATSDKLEEMDWAKNIQICELVARDPGKAKDIINAIKKCVGSRSKNTQLYAVMSAGVQFSNRPNIFVTRAEVPVPETRTEPNREILSTKSIGGQQEMATQPAADRLAADTRLRKRKALSQDYADKRLWAPNIRSPDSELRPDPAPMIPPPPSKHAERERFFREKSLDCWPIPGVIDPTGGILVAPQKLAQDVKDSPHF